MATLTAPALCLCGEHPTSQQGPEAQGVSRVAEDVNRTLDPSAAQGSLCQDEPRTRPPASGAMEHQLLCGSQLNGLELTRPGS